MPASERRCDKTKGVPVYKINSSLRSALLLGAATAAVISVSGAAFAQETVETVIVTGSRIPQQGIISATPVTSIGQQELQLQGTSSVETLLNNLPSVFAEQASEVSNGALGVATVNLRDLGSSRTLVLIDGKRLMPGDPDVGQGGEVADLNVIPSALVEHVEVVTGGASTVYGSDAVAGVVNFIMRKDFEGVEMDVQGGIANHTNGDKMMQGIVNAAGYALPKSEVWDGGNVNTTFVIGANSPDGKGNVTAYFGYRAERALLQTQRDFSACAATVNWYTSPPNTSYYCGGSSTNPLGRFKTLTRPANSIVNDIYRTDSLQQDSSGNELYALNSYNVDGASMHLFGTGANDYFNYAPYNYLQRPDTRYTGGAFAHYDYNQHLQVFSSFMFMDDHTIAQIAPSGLFYGTPYSVNCDNPLLATNTSLQDFLCGAGTYTAASVAAHQNDPTIPLVPLSSTDSATTNIGRRFSELGGRQDDLRHTDYRIVIGAKGEIVDGVTYEVSAQYSTAIYAENYLHDMSISRMQKAMQVVDVGGVPTCKSVLDSSDPNCVPLNIFTQSSVSPAAFDYVQGAGFKEGNTNERVLNANVTADLGKWGVQLPWADSGVQVNVGTEYRREELTLRVDDEYKTGDLAGQGGPTPNVSGAYYVTEGFGEARIPVVSNRPFVEDLTLNAGYRYSSYNVQGNASSYKYGFEWQSIDDIKLRGSYQRAVRAPNVNELFYPPSQGLWNGTDPCSGLSPQYSLTQCERTGVTPGQYGGIDNCSAAQCTALFSGSVALKPEAANTWSIGVVFTPTFVEGFSATIDYYNIKVNGLVGNIPQSIIIQKCAEDNLAQFCSLIHRAPGTGIIFGQGPAAGYIDSPNVNTGFLQSEGVDVTTNYQTDLDTFGLSGYGSLSANLIGTYQPTYKTQPYSATQYYPAGHVYNCAGSFGLVCGTPSPEWRHQMRVTWNSPWDFNFSVAWRHFSSVKFDGNSSDPSLNDGHPFDVIDAHIPAYDYFDLAGEWQVMKGLTLRGGVQNLFDKDPPVIDSGNFGISGAPYGNGNTYPAVYDSLGRTIFLAATVKF
jgi:outer membrane receptor protein involved in Fe transport